MTDHTADTASSTSQPHILVIGAGPGLGSAIAHRFAREGFAVTVAGRNQQRLSDLAGRLRESTTATVDTAVVDAADAADFTTALQELAQRITPQVVVYNAALLTGDDALTSSTDYLAQAFAINVIGAISAAQVFTPAMRGVGHGTFLVTGGGLGIYPSPEFATMSIGKAGLRAAAALLHDELKTDGVHVAGVTITGNIAPDTAFAPELIADAYWQLHAEPVGQWSVETIFDGR